MVSLNRIIHKMQGNKKGFTLIELMIVVAILGILAAIAIPNFMRFQAKSKQSEAKTNLGAIGTTAESYRSENDTYIIANISDLGWAPQGTVRYSYWYAVTDAQTVTMFPLGTGVNWSGGAASVDGCDRAADPTNAPASAAGSFTTTAKGQIDTDATCDEWTYNEGRILANPINDVSN